MANHHESNDVSITDIRREGHEGSLLSEVYEKLKCGGGTERTLPTMVLYDEKGLQLFEEITYLEEYYLTNAEIEVLRTHAYEIARLVRPGSRIVELGSGNLRKIKVLLDVLEDTGKEIEYCALDLSLSELKRTFSVLPKDSYKHVKYRGLFGTYDDGLSWLKQPANRSGSLCILTMGSSLGNFDREEAVKFLHDFANIMRFGDILVVGLDACQDEDKVFHAYNDKLGKTHEFILNGLANINNASQKEVFTLADWSIVGRYNKTQQCHQAFYQANRDAVVEGIKFEAGDRIRVEESHKYSPSQRNELWKRAGLVPRVAFGNRSDDYHIHVLSATVASFPLNAERYAANPVPTLKEFEHLWAVWDTVTRSMLPEEELLSKPIKLRNCCLFYLGHIPTFLDIHLSRATTERLTEPSVYSQIFERGIDPDVENPEKCHAHSEIPDTWPPAEEILAFQERVRNRARSIYSKEKAGIDPAISRALWIAFEHEAMHLETLLYMLVQSDRILPPPRQIPDFKALAEESKRNRVANHWFEVPATRISIGLDDAEDEFRGERYFGWDNEKPVRNVAVPAFQAKGRPITNQEYAQYLEQTCQQKIPVSWASIMKDDVNATEGYGSHVNGHGEPLTEAYLQGMSVRTVYGLVPLKHALDWPVFASFDELSGCAKWMNGRIPTIEEARSIYNHADRLKKKEAEKVQSRTISAVNGHLSNNGVEESPPSHLHYSGASGTERTPDPNQLFVNLEDCNVGFQNFHPVPVTQNGEQLSGQGGMGGAWEWTSSVLEQHEGFEPMSLYPLYTADFFDGKHNIVLGGSWATHPRIAGRKSFINWYQRNYA